ncbi:MAG: Crp/Fnr family transcriptional regulator [Mangrovibacterium sp.]
MINFEVLSKSPVFAGLAAGKLPSVFDGILYRVYRLGKNNIVATAGDECSNLIIVMSGTVKGEMNDPNGKIIKIENIEAPRPLAAAFLFGKNNFFPVTVITITETELLYIPRDEFLKLLQKDQRILTNYLSVISSRTQFLTQRIHFLSFKSIRQKIAHYLIELAGDQLSVVELQLTQEELAEFFGVTRPALARSLGELHNEGILHVHRRTIRILDKKKLRKMMNEN